MTRQARDDLWLPKDFEYSRFASKLKTSAEGCWLWTGSTHKVTGYGNFRSCGRVIKPHRWAYRFFIGEIPPDLEPDHLCKVRACCNPWHLDIVPPMINNQRANERTHCAKCGRPYEGNRSKEPGKRCRYCRMAYQRAYQLAAYHRKKI